MFGGNQYKYQNQNEPFNSNQSLIQIQGTKSIQYTPTKIDLQESNGQLVNDIGMSISFQSSYALYSFEELRMIDYQIRKQSQSNNSQGYNIPNLFGNNANLNALPQNNTNNNFTLSNVNSNQQNNEVNRSDNQVNYQSNNNVYSNVNYNSKNNGMSNNNNSNHDYFSQNTQNHNHFQPLQLQNINTQNQNHNLFAMNNANQLNNIFSKQNNSNNYSSSNSHANLNQTIANMNINMHSTNNQQSSLMNNCQNILYTNNNIQQQQVINQIPNQQSLNHNNLFSSSSQLNNINANSTLTNNSNKIFNNSLPINANQGQNPNLITQPQSFPSMTTNNITLSHISIPHPQQSSQTIYDHSNKAPPFTCVYSTNQNTQLYPQLQQNINISHSQPNPNPIAKNPSLLTFETIANQITQTASPTFEKNCSSIIQDTTNYIFFNSLQNKMDNLLIAFNNQLKQNEQLLKNSIDDKGVNELYINYAQYNNYCNQFSLENNDNKTPFILQADRQSNELFVNNPTKTNSVKETSDKYISCNNQYYKTNSYLKEIEQLGNQACELIQPLHCFRFFQEKDFNPTEFNKENITTHKSNNSSTSAQSNKMNTQLSFRNNNGSNNSNTNPPSINGIYTMHLSFKLVQFHIKDSNKSNEKINSLLNKPQSLTVSNDLSIESLKQLLANNLSSILSFTIDKNSIIIFNNNNGLSDDQLLNSIKSKSQLQYSFTNNLINELSFAEENELPKTSQFSLSPSIDEMRLLSKYHLSHLKQFSIYNEYGRITFPDETNVIGIDIDSIVTIEPFIVTAYRTKAIPPIGEELNKEAIIEIKIIPEEDEDTNEFILNLKETVKKLHAMFISYDTVNHLLIFKVNGFNPHIIENY